MKYLVTNPLNYFFALLFLSLIVYFFTKFKWYWKALPILGLLFVSIILTPIGANAMSRVVAKEAGRQQCDTDVAVVVADGWSELPASDSDFGALSSATLKQIDSAKHWLQSNETRKLIISAADNGREVSEQDLAYNYALATGIAPHRLTLNESDGSPAHAAEVLAKEGDVLAVTIIDSDLRSLRNTLAFEQHGFAVCNVIAEKNKISAHFLRMLTPSADSIELSQQVLWETVGIVWYWWEGKI